jgi:hypothetical protein
MKSKWHRLGVFLDLREDPRSGQKGARQKGGLLGLTTKSIRESAFGIAVLIAFFCIASLIIHLVRGNVDPTEVLVDGGRLLLGTLGTLAIVYLLGQWLYWIADRWVR